MNLVHGFHLRVHHQDAGRFFKEKAKYKIDPKDVNEPLLSLLVLIPVTEPLRCMAI